MFTCKIKMGTLFKGVPNVKFMLSLFYQCTIVVYPEIIFIKKINNSMPIRMLLPKE